MPWQGRRRLPFVELLFALGVAAATVMAAGIAAEVAVSGGNPPPVAIAPFDHGEIAAQPSCPCGRPAPVSAHTEFDPPGTQTTGTAPAFTTLSSRDRFLGETAGMRGQARAGARSDARADLLAATVAIRMLGDEMAPQVRPGRGGVPR
jgi:hypothetical protein